MSLLDRIEALPTELIHKIFEQYWDLSSAQPMYQLVMRPIDTFSIGTNKEPLNIGRTADTEGDSPYNDGRVEPDSEEYRKVRSKLERHQCFC